MMNAMATPTGRIEIKLRKVSQLFNTLDPSPFRESELALEAEDYIVARASGTADRRSDRDHRASAVQTNFREHRRATSQVAVKDHFEHAKRGADQGDAGAVQDRATRARDRSFHSLGMSVARLAPVAETERTALFAQILKESFLIFGWVAIWKPSDIFLYEWPPIARRRKLFRRLSAANVVLDSEVTLHSRSAKEENNVNSPVNPNSAS